MLAAATGTEPDRTQHMSTGIIGTRLPLERIREGLAALVPTLSATDDGLLAVRDCAVHDRFADEDRDHDRANCPRPTAEP